MGGLCFSCCVDGSPLGSPLTYNGVVSDSLTLAFGGRKDADKCEVFLTEVLKRFPFPEIEGERFVPESLIWFRIARAGYKLYCDDAMIYVCEYLADGYSANFMKNLRLNPRGFATFYKENLTFAQIPLKRKFKSLIRWLQCWYYQAIKVLRLS